MLKLSRHSSRQSAQPSNSSNFTNKKLSDFSESFLFKIGKKYIGIAKALFAYAIQVSLDEGFDGVLVFKAKTTELIDYYIREFGARHAGSYDPFRLVIWEDAAESILMEYREEMC